MTKGTIKQSGNFGVITGLSYVAGIIGNSEGNQVSDVANYGKIIGSSFIGGICGYSELESSTYRDNYYNCYNCGDISSTRSPTGGIIGKSRLGSYRNNLVNYGLIQSEIQKNTGALIGSLSNGKYTSNGYYLETSYPIAFGEIHAYTPTNINSMTSNQMKTQSFLDELNKNAKALGNSYSQWKFGKSGYPILSWIEE